MPGSTVTRLRSPCRFSSGVIGSESPHSNTTVDTQSRTLHPSLHLCLSGKPNHVCGTRGQALHFDMLRVVTRLNRWRDLPVYKRRILTGMTSLLVVGTLGLAGCSTNSSTTNNEVSVVGNSTSNNTQSHPSAQHKYLTSAAATLNPENGTQVTGAATMTLNTNTHELTVVAECSGLRAGEKYKVAIVNKTSGKTLYNLKSFTADKHGEGVVSTVFKNVKELPATNTRIGIYRGTALVASGDIKRGGQH
jgi:hypothetical protein